MLSKLTNLYFTDTGKDTSVVLVGTFVNIVIGGLFFIIAPRILGPKDYGLFSTLISTSLLIISISNFGIDSGILKFAVNNTPKFNKILYLAFKSYVYLGILAAAVGFFLAPLVGTFLNTPQLTPLYRIGFFGTIWILLTNFFVAALQAKGDYAKASIVNIAGNIARITVVIIAFKFFQLGLTTLTIIFFFAPVFSVITGLFLFPLKAEKTEKLDLVKFHKFNTWIALSLIISSVPFDNFTLLKIAGPLQTGLYSAPFKILTFAYMFGGNFTRVLASRFSSFDTNSKAKIYALKALPIPILFSLIIALTIPFSGIITRVAFGSGFQNSAAIYQILSVGFICFFLSTIPSSIIIYFLGQSRISFVITTTKYVIFLFLLILLIPKFGAAGAAGAFTIGELISLLLMTGYSQYKLSR